MLTYISTTICASMQIFPIPSTTNHFCSNEDVVASNIFRQISLKKISICGFKCLLYLVSNSIKSARDSSNTSMILDTPFCVSETHKYD